MCCVGKWFAAAALATAAVVAGFDHFTPAAAQPPTAAAKDVDLGALRDAVNAASKRGENVDEIATALDAFAKVARSAKPGSVPPELQALRDAVDAAASKGENVAGIAKELAAVETAVAGKSLAKPKPEPRPEPQPEPRPNFRNLPDLPFPAFPNAGGLGGGIDVQGFNKAMDLRKKAVEMMLKNPRDPEARKLLQEANEAMLKAAGVGAGAGPVLPLFPDFARVPDRARLGIRMERVPAVAADQLGLEPNTGIVVSMVTPNSAAEKAGLKVHDIIVEFAGKPVGGNTEDFARLVSDVKANEKVNMVVLRKGKKVEIKGVELPEAKRVGARPAFGELPRNPALPLNPAFRPAAARGLPAGFASASYTSGNGTFTLKASKGGARFTLTGTAEGGRVSLTNATVEEGGKTHTAASVDKLPEAYRADVEQLLKTVEPRR